MKVKRHKKMKKQLAFYKITFGIKPPFKVLMDSDFIQAALEGRIQLKEQMPKLLQEECTSFVTKCVVHELNSRPKFFNGAQIIAKGLSYLRCKHSGVVPPDECIRAFLEGNNSDKLLFAIQNVDLRAAIRMCPQAPLLFIRGNVPLMEPPSTGQKDEAIKLKTGLLENKDKKVKAPKDSMQSDKAEEQKESGESNQSSSKKRKGPKAPNPLSVKKKKVVQAPAPKYTPSNSQKKGSVQSDEKGPKGSGKEPQSVQKADVGPVENRQVIDAASNVDAASSSRKRKRNRHGKSIGEAATETAQEEVNRKGTNDSPKDAGELSNKHEHAQNEEEESSQGSKRKRRRKSRKGNNDAGEGQGSIEITEEGNDFDAD